MGKKLNLDNFWEKILLQFPLTCGAGPEVDLNNLVTVGATITRF